MRPVREPYRLSFLLPPGAMAGNLPVVAPPAQHGCEVSVYRAGLVVILGPSRDAVFECAGAALRDACRSIGPVSVAAVLMTPGRGFCGSDSWSIILGADVAFSPTGLPPWLPQTPARSPPRLASIDGRRTN